LFYTPTLDAFWALQESLTSLIDLLPRDLVRPESVQSLIALARAKLAIDAATTAVAHIVEGDQGTITAANISIVASDAAVSALSHHFGWDEIKLLPWYPLYDVLPRPGQVGAIEDHVDPRLAESMRLPPPIEVGDLGATVARS
jgi:hypothetical protein